MGPVTIGWSRTAGTATPGTDFSPAAGTLTFAAGVTSQSFDITAFDDGVAEGTETIVLSLAPPSAGALGPPSATTMTIFIVDAQQSVTFSSPTFAVGETTPQAVITVLRIGVPTGPVTVTATTVPAAVDPVAAGDSRAPTSRASTVPLTFGPGEIVKTFNVPIVTSSALIRDGNRVVGLQLVDPPLNAALVGINASTLTILDFRPDLVVASVASPSSGIAGKTLPTPDHREEPRPGRLAGLPRRHLHGQGQRRARRHGTRRRQPDGAARCARRWRPAPPRRCPRSWPSPTTCRPATTSSPRWRTSTRR